jgi:hypothetical protein
MLILASTTDKLQLTTQAAGTVDVHASWMDNAAGAVGPGRTNTPTITTATTTDIVAPPAASAQRNVKTLHVRNRGVAANTVIVVHTDGTTVVTLYSVPLQPGYTLEYIDGVGFAIIGI